ERFLHVTAEDVVAELELADGLALQIENGHFHGELLRLDLDVDACRQIELHERVEGLLRRLDDVEQALVGANLELLATLLVDVRPAKHGVATDLGRQGDRPRDVSARPLCGLDDVGGRLVEELVIERLEADPDLRGLSHGCLLLPYSRILVTMPAPTVLPPSRM